MPPYVFFDISSPIFAISTQEVDLVANYSDLEEKTLPNERLIRREEIINAFALDAGSSASQQGIEFTSEVAPVSNQTGHYRMAITLRNTNASATAVTMEYVPAMVDRYRLVGFDVDMGKQQVSKLLPAGAMTTIMLEIGRAHV